MVALGVATVTVLLRCLLTAGLPLVSVFLGIRVLLVVSEPALGLTVFFLPVRATSWYSVLFCVIVVLSLPKAHVLR